MNRLKQPIPCIIISLLLLTGCAGGSVNPQTNEEFAMTMTKKEVQIVDVRTPAEFAEGHLPNAVNIDFQEDYFIEKALAMLEKKHPVAIYCMKGVRSKLAGEKLAKEGYKIFELENGLSEWDGKIEK